MADVTDVTINVTVTEGGTIDATVIEGGQIEATLVGGAKGDTGATGATGGIVPITVSAIAPSSPGVNDLWIDTS